MDWIDMTGYAAMTLVAASIMMKDIVKLRILNMAGAIVFVFYGIMIESYPIVGLNFLLTGVNLYYLVLLKYNPKS